MQAALDLYLLELSQDLYRPEVHKALGSARRAQKRREVEEKRLLEKVGKMTIDADLPPTKAGPSRRKKR